MVETPLLWASGARKEVMDLLRTLWTSGETELQDDQSRTQLWRGRRKDCSHIWNRRSVLNCVTAGFSTA